MLLLAGFKQYPPTDLVDPDPAVGAVVHSVVVDEGVVAGPDGDSPSVVWSILSVKLDIVLSTLHRKAQ